MENSSPPSGPQITDTTGSKKEDTTTVSMSSLPPLKKDFIRIKTAEGKPDLLVYPNTHINVEGEGEVLLVDYLSKMIEENKEELQAAAGW